MGPERGGGGGVDEERPYSSNLFKGLGNAYHPSVSCHTPHSLNIQFPNWRENMCFRSILIPYRGSIVQLLFTIHTHRVGQS